MPNTIIINGYLKNSNEPTISAQDRGFTLGHGLFETILIKNGLTSTLEYHWNRLITSAEIIGITIPFNFLELKEMINTLLIKNNFQKKICSLRITVTDGISQRGLLSTDDRTPTYVLFLSEIINFNKKPIKAIISTIRKNELSFSHRVKSISYLDNILAKREALTRNADEAFMLNSKNHVTEGTISNIFAVKNQIIITPPVSDGLLPGITRHILLNDFKTSNYQIIEETINFDFLIDADEIFITNSLMGAVPVVQLENKVFNQNFQITELINQFLTKKFNYL
jgi:branched-chain amino acid aminotransferase